MANNKNNDSPANLSRRNLLKGASLVGAAVATGGAATQVIAANDKSSTTAQSLVREALEVVTAAESETLEAITDRILPTDENGPGAREARAVHYIDRSLASDNAGSRADYAIGLEVINEHAIKHHQQPFHRLSTSTQDEILTAVIEGDIAGFNTSGSGFFNMVRSHTIEGTFSDPYYGGNRNFIGWDLLGYPGVRFSASESDVAQGSNLAPAHQSAYDISTFTKVITRTGGAGNGN